MSFGAASRRFREGAKRRGQLTHEGIRYASRAELFCARTLQAFCGWQAIEGQTYQVPIGHNKAVDFVVNGVFVEFHPIILSREMHKPAYRQLTKALEKVSPEIRHQLKEAFRSHLLETYTSKRDWTMRLHTDPRVCEAELLVISSARSWYEQVLKRFSEKRLPGKKSFLAHMKAVNFPGRWNE